MRFTVCLLAAIACGGSTRPRDLRASVRDGAVEVSWEAVPLVALYRVQLVDLDSGAPASAAVIVRGTRAVIPGTASGVEVDALPGGRASALVGGGAQGGTGSAWQVFAPWDFRDRALSADFGRLAPEERLAVLLVNSGGRDQAQVEVSVEGAGDPGAAPSQLVLQAAATPPALHELMRAQESALALEPRAPAEAVQSGPRASFCVVPGLDFSRHVRKAATLAGSTAHAEIYLDDEDLGEYEGPDVQALSAAFEERVWPAILAAFGPPGDVDGNGKLVILLTHELGAHLNGGWLMGYFGNADLVRGRDDSEHCSQGGSNHGEIVYLNDLRAGQANGYAAQDLLATVYPATLAHELQHLLNFQRRCVDRACDGPEEIWINEALSKVAEDLAGFGWNGPGGRAEGSAYLRCADGALRGYDGRSLTQWEGDPIGNYQGAHSFLRLFTDRMGSDLVARVAFGPGGVAGLEEALRMPLPYAMVQWASALLLSNEPDARYSYSGAGWSPLHDRLRHLDTRSPGELSLRRDGIAAVMSGPGLGGAARLTVRSLGETAPYVVVARASAALPPR